LPEPQGQDSEAGADDVAVGLVDMEGVMAGQEGGGGKCGVSGRTGRGMGAENENEYENENEGGGTDRMALPAADKPSRASTLLRGAGIRGCG
jgi:hypothetical protein